MPPHPTTSTHGSIGSDPSALDELAAAMRGAARAIDGLPGAASRLRRSGWSGPDAEVVRDLLGRADRRRTTATSMLRAAARHLDAAARRQREASLAAAAPRVTVTVDRAADGGRLVQWVGRTDAPVVVVLVPGVGTDRADRDRLRADAERLWWRLAGEVDDPASVAVVSWLGYDPPDVVVGAVDPRPAAEGADLLAAAVERWRAGGDRRVVLVGHSYGGVVVGRAVADAADGPGHAVAVVVQLGAPGVGAPGATARIASAGVALVAVREPGDPISLAAAVAGRLYGEDPVGRAASLPTSGRGHGAYLHDEVLLRALADLAVGPTQPVPSRPWASPWTSRAASPRS